VGAVYHQENASLHFLALVAFLAFIAIHVSMVFVWGWGQLNASIIFGSVRNLTWEPSAHS
jgi:thiosulfate reductase cytochrome b subunit